MTHMRILTLALALSLTYHNHCPISCQTDNQAPCFFNFNGKSQKRYCMSLMLLFGQSQNMLWLCENKGGFRYVCSYIFDMVTRYIDTP